MDEILLIRRTSIARSLSWWNQRTITEKWLFAITGVCLIVIICLASVLPSSKSKTDVCLTESCIRESVILLEKINRSVDPCDDFYDFACGNIVNSPFTLLRDKVNEQILTLLDKPIQKDDSQSAKLVKTLYNACMDTTKIDKEGLDFVKKDFKDCGGWPVIDPEWNETIFDWNNTVACFQTKNLTGYFDLLLMSMAVISDSKNSSKYIFTISQPDIEYELLEKDDNYTLVYALRDSLIKIAVLFGADQRTATKDAQDALIFGYELSKFIVRKEEQLDRTSLYNPITIGKLQENFPYISWLNLINSQLYPTDSLTSNDVVNLLHPKYFEKLQFFLSKVEKRVIANAMFFDVVGNMLNYLPEDFRKIHSRLKNIILGEEEVITSRGKVCVEEASTSLQIGLSSMYIKNFNKNIKSKITELIHDVKNSLLDTLERVEWMDTKTRTHALLKLDKMGALVAYPEEILDDKKIDDYHQNLKLDPDDNFLNIRNMVYKFDQIKEIKKLRTPVNRHDWRETADSTHQVNAFYSVPDNFIVIPAAILQDHFFNQARPQCLNYGAIGEIIGHEITHGFDSQGRQFDKNGNLADWWEPETLKTFTEKSQCFVRQYSNYYYPELGMRLNGVQTLPENIADNGGINIAYEGYSKWLERNQEELPLPALPYTPRQLFWISAATTWCERAYSYLIKYELEVDTHVPNYFRVVIPFMNSESFAKDFNCPLGSKMNPKDKCHVW